MGGSALRRLCIYFLLVLGGSLLHCGSDGHGVGESGFWDSQEVSVDVFCLAYKLVLGGILFQKHRFTGGLLRFVFVAWFIS